MGGICMYFHRVITKAEVAFRARLAAFHKVFNYSSPSLGSDWLPRSLSSSLWKEPFALKFFPIMQTDKGMLFKKPTANLLIIIYLRRPRGIKVCKNHSWYMLAVFSLLFVQ